MLRLLKGKGFELLEVTTDVLKTTELMVEEPINDGHVLLLWQKFTTAEDTWQVIYNNLVFHGLQIRPLSKFEFLNNPIVKYWLVRHPEWGQEPPRQNGKEKEQKKGEILRSLTH